MPHQNYTRYGFSFTALSSAAAAGRAILDTPPPAAAAEQKSFGLLSFKYESGVTLESLVNNVKFADHESDDENPG